MPRGYDRDLYIQPFDHRGSFQTKMFGWKPPLSAAQTAEIAAAKQVIYEGFKAAVVARVPKEKAGILVDEQFGGRDQVGCIILGGGKDDRNVGEWLGIAAG